MFGDVIFSAAESGGITIGVATVISVFIATQGVIAVLFKLLMASKDREYATMLREKERDVRELEQLWKSFRDISVDNEKVMRTRENSFRAKEGLPPLEVLLPVRPEAFSPSTELSRANAEIATLRASLAQIKISAGIPADPFPEAGDEKR